MPLFLIRSFKSFLATIFHPSLDSKKPKSAVLYPGIEEKRLDIEK
jgi:hypothetical protein